MYIKNKNSRVQPVLMGVVLPIILFLVMQNLGVLGFYFLLGVLGIDASTLDPGFVYSISILPSLAIFCVYYYVRKNNPTLNQIKFGLDYLGIKNGILIVLSTLSALLVIPLIYTILRLNELFPMPEEVASTFDKASLSMGILAFVIIAPIIEELVFRGIIYKTLRNTHGIPVAVGVSSILFGAIHLNVAQGVNAFFIGVLCALVYEKFRTLRAPLLVHMTLNLVATLSDHYGTNSGQADPVSYMESVITLIPVALVGAIILTTMCLLIYRAKPAKRKKARVDGHHIFGEYDIDKNPIN